MGDAQISRSVSDEDRLDHTGYITAVASALARCRGLRVVDHACSRAQPNRRLATVHVAFGDDALRLDWDDGAGWRSERDTAMTALSDEVVPAPGRVVQWVLLLVTARHDLYDQGAASNDPRDTGELLAAYTGHERVGEPAQG